MFEASPIIKNDYETYSQMINKSMEGYHTSLTETDKVIKLQELINAIDLSERFLSESGSSNMKVGDGASRKGLETIIAIADKNGLIKELKILLDKQKFDSKSGEELSV